MNKYLMMTAAALLGSAPAALASNNFQWHTIHFYSQGGSPYCDGMIFHRTGEHLAVGRHLNEDCGGQVGQVAGTVDKRRYTLFETWTNSGYMLGFDIDKPIRDGGTWKLWTCYSGTTCFEGSGGIYHLGFAGRANGHVPTASKVREMIAARKAAQGRPAR